MAIFESKKKASRPLTLILKGEYFDAIQRGEKTEEYRLCNNYWRKRLENRDYDQIILTRGYAKRDDDSKRMYFRYEGYTIKSVTHPHFGDDPVNVFAIPVGRESPHPIDVALASAGFYDA